MAGLMWFRFKTLNVIVNGYGYPAAIPGWQTDTFTMCTRLCHGIGIGPYDAAALFMLVQLNHMVSANPAPDSDEGQFTLEIAEKIRATLPQCREAASVETCVAAAVRQWIALTDSAPEG
jgi:hypothetical protein